MSATRNYLNHTRKNWGTSSPDPDRHDAEQGGHLGGKSGVVALDVSRNTVRRYLRVEGLPRYEREARPSKLDPYTDYIEERVNAAAPDWIPATVLLRELRALGYSGGYSILKDHLATLRPVTKPEPLMRF